MKKKDNSLDNNDGKLYGPIDLINAMTEFIYLLGNEYRQGREWNIEKIKQKPNYYFRLRQIVSLFCALIEEGTQKKISENSVLCQLYYGTFVYKRKTAINPLLVKEINELLARSFPDIMHGDNVENKDLEVIYHWLFLYRIRLHNLLDFNNCYVPQERFTSFVTKYTTILNQQLEANRKKLDDLLCLFYPTRTVTEKELVKKYNFPVSVEEVVL